MEGDAYAWAGVQFGSADLGDRRRSKDLCESWRR